ncbi:hypothetical protein Kpol_1032p32 [Vanderwaltozyma polyspora DSM 70294]|uniref:Uncharacterized protein n=1 Tax=Vanderwaltozyma polyspora (strain ATCC 22028 / DSM 70294 / BCRC 21397 / CBS 2163 / NBRC 10782 / NRRL Y-8283 / UCD 57-17) TaxID=436907 RepID=A7TGY7_VANPO|nr:uncharacterized protein Kpol_1032p32 [Vanderwaltozyma polyspora DSM 70294]EDO18439.1 hypothetical protein Kpol_1032p32 [Vanderwaltozyma polyspora DSM 70294]
MTSIVQPPELIATSVDEQVQYKIELLLHVNSILLSRLLSLTNNSSITINSLPENLQNISSQYLKRIHSNLQCISQMNQGLLNSKPLILDPPQQLSTPNDSSNVNPQQDLLAKFYLLLNRVFEIWQ